MSRRRQLAFSFQNKLPVRVSGGGPDYGIATGRWPWQRRAAISTDADISNRARRFQQHPAAQFWNLHFRRDDG
jgi:hypothetical protein